MTTEKRRLYALVGYGTFFITPLWCLGLWAFNGEEYLLPYLIISICSETIAFIIILLQKENLFWYYITVFITFFSSMVLGLFLNTGALLTLAFSKYLSANLIMNTTILAYAFYCLLPLKYYRDDYYRTEKDRLSSFDFKEGTYAITKQSLVRENAFSDYYTKSFLSKAHFGIIRLHLLFPIGGGAIAIIAGNVSKSFQLTIGIIAVILTSILSIQGTIVSLFNAWQVLQLEKRYGKKIRILWGDEKQ